MLDIFKGFCGYIRFGLTQIKVLEKKYEKFIKKPLHNINIYIGMDSVRFICKFVITQENLTALRIEDNYLFTK